MTLVSIDIKNAGYETGPDDRVVIYSPANRNEQGTIISTAETTIPLVDGHAEKDLAPGPVVVKILARGVADTREKSGYVPESVEGADPISLWDVIVDWTPALVDQGILAILAALDGAIPAIESARDDAVSQVEGAVDSAVGEYFERSTNLLNPATVTEGWVLLEGSGTPTENATYSLSAPIPVTAGQTYTSYRPVRASFFNGSEFVSSTTLLTTEAQTWVVPAGATSVRLTILKNYMPTAQLNAGPTLLPYEPWHPPHVPADRLDLTGVQPAGDYLEGPVTPGDTSFFQGGVSTNLFDLSTASHGWVLLNGSATPTENPTYYLSAPIPVVAGQMYTAASILRLTWLNAAGGHVQTTNAVTGVPVTQAVAPVGAVSVRVSASTVMIPTTQLNVGSELLPYEPGGATTPTIPARYLDLPDAGDRLDDHMQQPGNLFNRETATRGWMLPDGSGTPVENEFHSLTETIPVTAGQTYTSYRPGRVTFFAGTAFVSSMTLLPSEAQTWVVPTGATHMRLTVNNNYLSSAQLNAGSELLPYEPWHPPHLSLDLLPQQAWFPTHPADPFIVDTAGLEEVFDAPTVDAQPGIYTAPATEVYGWWDALVTAHPEYVTRRDLGVASDGTTPMYAYILKPEEVPSHVDGDVLDRLIKPLPAAFLMAGTHGYEETGVYSLWRLAKALCEEWHTSPVLDALRWNIEIVAVPLVNPVGWGGADNDQKRKNANGVDLARNFATGWAPSDPTSATYGGPSALSEAESQAIDALMAEVSHRGVFGTSFHNFSSSAEQPWMIWNVGGTQMMLTLGKRLISRMSRKWRQDHDWIALPDRFFGWSDMELPGGTEGMALVGHGIPGSTFETSQWCRLDGTPGVKYDSRVMTLSYEAVVNYVAMGISEGIKHKPAPE